MFDCESLFYSQTHYDKFVFCWYVSASPFLTDGIYDQWGIVTWWFKTDHFCKILHKPCHVTSQASWNERKVDENGNWEAFYAALSFQMTQLEYLSWGSNLIFWTTFAHMRFPGNKQKVMQTSSVRNKLCFQKRCNSRWEEAVQVRCISYFSHCGAEWRASISRFSQG